MTKVIIRFLLQVNELLKENEKVFVTGSLPELGSWQPIESKCLMLQDWCSTHNREIWGNSLLVPLCNFEFRYFIGIRNENESCDDKGISIISWESSIEPRKMILLDHINDKQDDAVLDIYGNIDGHSRLLNGWLTDTTAVRIRIFGDSIRFYHSRFRLKRNFLRCHYFQMNRNKYTDESNSYDLDYRVAKVSKLSEDFFKPHLPPAEGTEYSTEDHLTFHLQTNDLEDMGIDIEIRQLSSESRRRITSLPKPNSSPVLAPLLDTPPISQKDEVVPEKAEIVVPTIDDYILVGTARLGIMPSKRVTKSISIYNKYNRPIGEIKVDFLAVFPLIGHRYTMDLTYQMHWKHRATLKVGHKGSGTSYGHMTKMSTVRENTIFSLKNAFQHGADFVEFDVQLSKDLIPVIYHDFKVCTVMRKKRKNDLQFTAIPVKDLTLMDLHALKLDHTSAMTDVNSVDIMNMEDADPSDLQPFPTLQDCLEQVNSPMGFNIELKYPQELKSGESEQWSYVDRNLYVDTILKIVAMYAKERNIIFSCFDADICLMVSLKQNKYPIIFLTQGNTTEYEAYRDPRTHSLENAMYFAKSYNILGLCAFSSNVADNIHLVRTILDHKLILFLWGDSNNDMETHQRWIDLGVHAIIFDRIHELVDNDPLNIFLMQRSSLTQLAASTDTSEC